MIKLYFLSATLHCKKMFENGFKITCTVKIEISSERNSIQGYKLIDPVLSHNHIIYFPLFIRTLPFSVRNEVFSLYEESQIRDPDSTRIIE